MKEIINCIIELGDKVIEHEEEIERLNKSLDTATEIINNKQIEIVVLNNIKNEVREYINSIGWNTTIPNIQDNVLRILDKESKQ